MKPLLSVLIVAAGLLVSLAVVPPTLAQSPPLTWEKIGFPEGALDVVVQPGSDGDTLYVVGIVGTTGVYRLAPGDAVWSDDLHTPTGAPRVLLFTQAETLAGGSAAGPVSVDRSPDGGRTWQRLDVGEGVECLFERPSDGALLACADDPDLGVFASFDDGLTWEVLGPITAETPSVANVLAEHPSAGPDGGLRLVAGVQNGLAYSDDGGLTWAKSNVWGEFRWWGDAFALAVVSSPANSDPPGTLYATARDFFDAHAVVFASSDGGATWAERSRPGIGFSDLVALPDGSLLLAVEGEQPEAGAKMWRSFDGGRTWRDEINGYDNAGVGTLLVGSDGRVYLTGESGVWRTEEGVPVAAEDGPEPGKPGAELEVYPNPSDGSVTVALTLIEAAAVTVAVFDVAGREVAVLHDGRRAVGIHEFAFDTGKLPAGTYVVRAIGDGMRAMQQLTVVR